MKKVCYNVEAGRESEETPGEGGKRMVTKTPSVGRLTLSLRPERLTAAMRACAAWTAIEEHDKILDMACGNGALLAHLNEQFRLTLCGMSDSPEQARAVREQLEDADVIYARMEDIPWRDNTFDAVLLPGSIRGDPGKALDEALRVLRPGGQFVMSCPIFHVRGEGDMNRREIMRTMQEVGFQEVSFRTSGLTGVIIGWKQGIMMQKTAER